MLNWKTDRKTFISDLKIYIHLVSVGRLFCISTYSPEDGLVHSSTILRNQLVLDSTTRRYTINSQIEQVSQFTPGNRVIQIHKGSNGPDSPSNGLDGPSNGTSNDPDGRAGDRRLQQGLLTNQWIMSPPIFVSWDQYSSLFEH